MATSSSTRNRPCRAGQFKLLLALATVLISLLAACAGQETPGSQPAVLPGETPSASAVSFSKDVLPILQSRCMKCHGGEKTEKGLNMTSYEKLMAGSQKGAAVIPGDVDKSPFVQLILQGKMPKSGPKLLPAQLQVLIDWVRAGALNN